MVKDQSFSISSAQAIVKDLFEVNPSIYWMDFLLSIGLGWGSFYLAVSSPLFSLKQVFSLVVSVFSIYRAVIFTHELAHLKKGTFTMFRIIWNLSCGFPFLIPSFTYMWVHLDHHKPKVYGTREDSEYVPYVLQGLGSVVIHFLMMLFVPFLFTFRYLLTPFSYLIPAMRRILWERFSTLSIDPGWRRPLPQDRDGKWWPLQEFMTFVYASVFIALLIIGTIPLKVFFFYYLVYVLVLEINAARDLGASHCFRNPSESILGFEEQFLDSINVPGNPVTTPLWAPVNLHYHALHHLFPSMPYHNFGEAHRRLVSNFPPDSPYHRTIQNNLWDGFNRLLRETREARNSKSPLPIFAEKNRTG